MSALNVVPFLTAGGVIFLAMLLAGVILLLLDILWSWIDEKPEVEYNLADTFGDYFGYTKKTETLKIYAYRSTRCDNFLNSKGYDDKEFDTESLTKEHREEMLRRFPNDFDREEELILRWPTFVIFLGPLSLWFVLSFWLLTVVVGGIVGVLFLARQIRRLCKRVNAHIEDPDAHKKS